MGASLYPNLTKVIRMTWKFKVAAFAGASLFVKLALIDAFYPLIPESWHPLMALGIGVLSMVTVLSVVWGAFDLLDPT